MKLKICISFLHFHPWESAPKSILLQRQEYRTGWGPLNAATHSFSLHTKPVRNSKKAIHLFPQQLCPSPQGLIPSLNLHVYQNDKYMPLCKLHSQLKDKSQVKKQLCPILTNGALPPPQKREMVASCVAGFLFIF